MVFQKFGENYAIFGWGLKNRQKNYKNIACSLIVLSKAKPKLLKEVLMFEIFSEISVLYSILGSTYRKFDHFVAFSPMRTQIDGTKAPM